MRPRPILWFVISLLCLVGALYFWRRGEEWAGQKATAPATQPAPGGLRKKSASTPRQTVTAASTAPMVLLTQLPANQPASAKGNPFPYRLSNTGQSVGQLLRNDHAILLENALVDTEKPMALAIPPHLRAQGDPGSYIVQARGPLDNAFRARLRDAGAEIVAYIPNNAYLVRASASAVERLAASAQAVLPYEPYYKLKASLLESAVKRSPLPKDPGLNLVLFSDTAAATTEAVKKLGAEVVGEDRSPFGPVLRVRPVPDSLALLAGLPGVQTVEWCHPRVWANDLSRVRVGVSSDTVATANYLNLTGSNVLVNVNDTGVDATHPDFATPPNKVTGDSPASLVDSDGHGTHVAGIIAGDGTQSPTVTGARGSINPGVLGQYRGKAPRAKLFVQSTGLRFGPASDATLQEAAARTNALISNNSWLYGDNNTYGIASSSYDAAVRDALPRETGSQPVLFVFAAGNAGEGNDSGLSGDPGGVLSPATAKNVITVGAIEQPRDITNVVLINCTTTNINGTNVTVCTTNQPWQGMTSSDNQVASFSSRGNVGRGIEGDFGRFKPDVVAPGTFVISTRSTMWDEKAYYNPTSHHVIAFEGQIVQTNSFYYNDVFLPNNAVGFTLGLLNMTNVGSLSQVTSLPIFVRTDDYPILVPPAFDFVRTNFVSVPPDGGGVGAKVGQSWYYGVLNTNTPPEDIRFDIIHDVITTNDLGNYLEVLSNLNNSISGTNATTHYYRYESGTSLSAADVSGTLALMQQYFQERQITNSPAMMKALLINGARSVGTLYDYQVQNSINYQGWGLIKLPNSIRTNGINNALPNSMFLFDQSRTNALATGQRQTRLISVNPAGRTLPLRVTLVWTDPPGNPAAAIKLVNDLDLIVTNLTTGEIYYGNDFPVNSTFTFASDTNAAAIVDLVNNVENVYLTQPLGTNYSVTVSAHRVNVNAVTAHTNDVVQDFALVISSGDGESADALTLTQTSPISSTSASNAVTVISNLFSTSTFSSASLTGQRVGANTPLLGTTNGMTNQWHFYIITNTTAFTNASFLISASTDLAIPRIGVFEASFLNATRESADVDLYVSLNPGLIRLDPAVIAGADKSLSRNAQNGDEAVIYSNSVNSQVYYIGVKSEDQQAGEFEFFAVFSLLPLGQEDTNGFIQAYPFYPPDGSIPDGSPDDPGVAKLIAFVPGEGEVRRVVVTNSLLHENIPDLVGALVSPNRKTVVLNNHNYPPTPPSPGPYNSTYEDNDEGDIPGAIHPDGPGKLRDFVGDSKRGQWRFFFVDNSLSQTGRVADCKIKVERQPENGEPITGTVLPNSWQYYAVNVPVGATNLSVCLALISASPSALQVYVRKDQFPTATNYDYTLTVNPPTGPPPGVCLSITRYDLPPLSAGKYYVGVFNGNVTSQTYVYTATYYVDPGSISPVLLNSGGAKPMLDDAVTNSSIWVTNIPNPTRIATVEVGLRVDHPRVSDLAFTLISPQGTRVLLMENRGRTNDAGIGTTLIITNIVPVGVTNGGSQPVTNVIPTGVTSGSLTINYDFFTIPDRMTVYYETTLLLDTGFISGAGTFNVAFGPGVSTDVSIVINEGGNPSTTTGYQYVVGNVQTNHNYLIFTENTNLTTTPIKFATPPFVPTTTTTTVPINGFDTAVAADYIAPVTVDGWDVTMKQVTVVNDPATALSGQFLALADGAISRTLSTTIGRKYNLSYAARGPNIVSWWRGENSTVDAADGNNGTLVGNTTFSLGVVGQAFVLDGNGDRVQVGNPANLRLQDFTLEAWIKRSSLATISFDDNVGARGAGGLIIAYGQQGYGLGLLVNGQVFLSRLGVDNTVVPPIITNTAWHHLAVTKLGSTAWFYVDGVRLPPPVPTPYNTTYTFTTPLAVGSGGDGLGGTFYGTIDEPSVYKRALSASEVKAIYTAGGAGKYNSVVAAPDNLSEARITVGNSTTNTIFANNTNWQTFVQSFTATQTGTPLQIEGLHPGVLLDSFALSDTITSGAYYLPEESLSALTGENAYGEWQLEIWDSRTGMTNNVSLVSWQLGFVFENTTPLPRPLIGGSPTTNTVPPGQILYFVVDVPAAANFATNTLLFASPPPGVNVLFNQSTFPTYGATNAGDYNLIPASTGGAFLLSAGSTPPLVPGQRYYLGVENLTPGVVTFALQVDFDLAANFSTNFFIWAGVSNVNQFWSTPGNWVGNVAPAPLSSNIVYFRGNIQTPYNWPHIRTNYGATILIFSNNITLNGIEILAGSNNTMNLGPFVRQDSPLTCYFGIDSPIHGINNYNFTNALGDASVGGQTDFQCIGGRLDVYGVLTDGAGANSRLLKTGGRTLNLTGMFPNTYTGGTIVNAGAIKMQKPPGYDAIPGDVTVNGTGSLVENVPSGEQIADTAIVTLNDSASFDMAGQSETVQTIQSTNASTSISNVNGILTVAPMAGGAYNSGTNESDFAGTISGNLSGPGTVQMNGTGTYGMLGTNAVANLTVNSGTLKVNGNSGTGTVFVNSVATLLVRGTLDGTLIVAPGGTVGAGFSPGKLILGGGLNMSGATNVWELATLTDDATGVPGVDFDQIVLTGGALVLDDQSTLDIRFIDAATPPNATNSFWQSPHSWTIISLNGGFNPGPSNFGYVQNSTNAAGEFTVVASDSGIVLNFTPDLDASTNNYIWDNQDHNGLWNDRTNWGILNNKDYNVAPTISNFVTFRQNFSPAGTVKLTADGFARGIRQQFARDQRTITIDDSQTNDRTLTLGGTGAALIDGRAAGVDFTLDGTPNTNGARLKLQIDGSGTSDGTKLNKAVTLRVSCDVSGAGGFILNGGLDGPGRLILSGANAYTGPTTINAGFLLVNGSNAPASAVTINKGATLGGAGIIGGPVTIASGGELSPGNSLGTLTVNNDLTLGGDLVIEVNKSASPSNDMVLVSGTLTNTGAGTVQVYRYGPVLVTGDKFKIFNKPLLNGQALRVLSAGHEIWTNKLAVDGTIEVLVATNTPITGDPTTVYTWIGREATAPPWKVPMQIATNWIENQAPAPGSSSIQIYQGDILVPWNWPYVDTNYGTTILLFSNNMVLNSTKILGGSNNTMNLGSYARQDTAQPCYYGITGRVPIIWNGGAQSYWSTNAYFTNALGDASCGSQTEFQCIGGRLDIYGVLRDGAGTSSRLVKSGNNTLNITGDLLIGGDANTYSGGTIINAGVIKMQKLPGINAIPGDVTVHGTGVLQINIAGGEQIADSAIVTLNDFGKLILGGQQETVRTVQGSSAGASIELGTMLPNVNFTVAPLAGVVYNGGIGESDFAGSVSGNGTVQMNGTGTYGMLGVNSARTLIVNSGTLKVNGNSGTGAVTVNTGGTLLGKGTIAGAVTVASGGTISAGFSAGQLTLTAGLNLSAGGNGATNVWELAALKDNTTGVAGTDFDQIVVAGGTLALGTQATLDIRFTGSASAPNFGNPFWQSVHSWTIISLSGGSNPGPSNFGTVKNGSYAAGNFTTAAIGSKIVLTFRPNSVPTVTPLRITTITGAGTGTVTVYYTNTIPGTNYFLLYNTDLRTTNWFTAGSKTAAGTSDFQTDNSATGSQRYYRVSTVAGLVPPVTGLHITTITAGAGSATITYTNTLPGTNYVLAYRTNLNATNWSTAGTKTAVGTGDFQTDGSATNRQRYYRVYYVTP